MSNRTTSRGRRSLKPAIGNDNGRLKVYSMMFVCVLVLLVGFFFAARQHFASIDYGFRNSRLRKQLDDLEVEKRRLMVAREVSLSPAEIKKSAKRLGIAGSDGDVGKLASETKDLKTPQVASGSLVRATSISAPAPSLIPTAYVTTASKAPKIEKSAKHSNSDKQKKGRTQIAAVFATE